MRFTDSHEWIEEGVNLKKVGITAHAQQELGDIVYVELPKVGSQVKKGEVVAVLESTKAAADIYAPITGKIIEVNTQLKEDPSPLNHSPEKEGWIYKIEGDEGLSALLTKDQYDALMS